MLDYLRSFPGQVKSTIGITIVLSIFFILFYFIKLRKIDPMEKTPKWIIPFTMIVDLINNFVKTNIGKRWRVYAPYFTTLAIFLFTANTCSIFGLTPPTNYVVNNAALAVLSFLIIQVTGIVSNGILGYLKSFLEPIFLLLPINIISELSLPLSLCLRLFGNILSGTVLSTLITGVLGPFCIPFLPLYNIVFDIGFGIIQTAVFVILSIVFTSMKIKDEEKIYSN